MQRRDFGGGELTVFGNDRRDEVLLLRGLGTWIEDYIPLIELLTRKYAVIVTSMSKMQGFSPQPSSIDEYIDRLGILHTRYKLSPRFEVGHSLGGHLVLRDVIPFERGVAISPIVPVPLGAFDYFRQAILQAVKMSFSGPDPTKGREISLRILDKCSSNLRDIIKFAKHLDSAEYVFSPARTVLAIEARHDEFFPPIPETRKYFEHKNIVHRIVDRNHAWPLLYSNEVYDTIDNFFEGGKVSEQLFF